MIPVRTNPTHFPIGFTEIIFKDSTACQFCKGENFLQCIMHCASTLLLLNLLHCLLHPTCSQCHCALVKVTCYTHAG